MCQKGLAWCEVLFILTYSSKAEGKQLNPKSVDLKLIKVKGYSSQSLISYFVSVSIIRRGEKKVEISNRILHFHIRKYNQIYTPVESILNKNDLYSYYFKAY